MAGDAVPKLIPSSSLHGRLVAPRARYALVWFSDGTWRLCQVTCWRQLSRYKWDIQLAVRGGPPAWYAYDPGRIRPPPGT
jgi:hypothetical protein